MHRIQVRARARTVDRRRRPWSPWRFGVVSVCLSAVLGVLASGSAFLVASTTSSVVRLLALIGVSLLLILAGIAGMVACVALSLGLIELVIGWIERAMGWLRPPAPVPTLAIQLARRASAAGRCPFCHLDLDDPAAAHLPRVECGRCHALQHHACLGEAQDQCSACRTVLIVTAGAPLAA